MTISSDVAGLLSESGAPALKFPEVGASAVGTIQAAAVTDQRDLDGNVRTWDDGNPRKQIVITLETDQRDGADDDGTRRLFAKGQMISAIREALKVAGAKELEVGGRLAIKHHELGTPPKPGYSAPKLFQASYKPPAPSTSVGIDDLL